MFASNIDLSLSRQFSVFERNFPGSNHSMIKFGNLKACGWVEEKQTLWCMGVALCNRLISMKGSSLNLWVFFFFHPNRIQVSRGLFDAPSCTKKMIYKEARNKKQRREVFDGNKLKKMLRHHKTHQSCFVKDVTFSISFKMSLPRDLFMICVSRWRWRQNFSFWVFKAMMGKRSEGRKSEAQGRWKTP